MGGAVPLVVPFALKKLFAGASDDYAVGADKLNELSGHDNPDTHKTAFYGVEYAQPKDDPMDNGFISKQLIWRMLGTSSDAVSNSPVFEANEDQDLVNVANKTIAEYQAKSEICFFLMNSTPDCSGNPLAWLYYGQECAWHEHYKNLYNTYSNAFRWAQGVDRQWKIIIGAYGFQEVSLSPNCLCETPDGEYTLAGPSQCEFNPTHCHWTPSIGYEPVLHESDGVVTAESQQAFPGTSGNYRMDYANHFQERNSEPTRLALLRLYNSGAGDGWFITDEK